ncbi:MAG: DUF624 domain-containing protein [Oscillospiraceae bacterium]|nr:DUF624 domain-containing protein [Oscillospiraceae bacterium]
MKIIDPNSPFLQALGKLSDIVFCNIMFVLFSIPIFTIGASSAALYNCMQMLLEDREDDLVARDFWRAFKANFWQATAIWLMMFVVIVFLLAFYFITSQMLDVLGRGYLLPYFLIVFLFVCGYQYLFPILARYKLKLKDIIKNAYLLSIAALPWTLLALAITVFSLFLTFKMMSFDMGLFIWAILGFGVVYYMHCMVFRKAFQKLDPQLPLQARKPAEGALFVDEEHTDGRDNMTQVSTFSDPNWNRQEYHQTDRKDVKGKSSGMIGFKKHK